MGHLLRLLIRSLAVGIPGKFIAGNLHGFWDGVLGTGESPSAVVSAAAALPPADAEAAAVADPQLWLDESFRAIAPKKVLALLETAEGGRPADPDADPAAKRKAGRNRK